MELQTYHKQSDCQCSVLLCNLCPNARHLSTGSAQLPFVEADQAFTARPVVTVKNEATRLIGPSNDFPDIPDCTGSKLNDWWGEPVGAATPRIDGVCFNPEHATDLNWPSEELCLVHLVIVT